MHAGHHAPCPNGRAAKRTATKLAARRAAMKAALHAAMPAAMHATATHAAMRDRVGLWEAQLTARVSKNLFYARKA